MSTRDPRLPERRLLAAFAHPDDESYGPCGTLKSVAESAGGRVRLVVATRGEAGSLGISRDYSPARLARIRQAEMFAAAAVLGAEVAFLGYPDKGLEATGPATAVADLVREIRLFQPAVLLTFHPNGLSGHPDHIAMTRYVTKAFSVAADPGFRPDLGPAWLTGRLYYYAISDSRAEALTGLRRLHSIPDSAAEIVHDVSPWMTSKHRACLAHATQLALYEQLGSARPGLEHFWSHEFFVLGEGTQLPATYCSDLFYGL